MIITLDSDAKASTTDDRDAIFEKHGFFRLSPKKEIQLPESTYIGVFDSEEAGAEKVGEIWEELKNAGCKPTRICGGIMENWKVIQSTFKQYLRKNL